ncbi:MAG: hypothetical protein ACLRX6_06525 [Limosilactobacillus pontis]|uniref:hypothetical protein n=1 Tax=Limosilactobacillus pontis TaxID=35787 RepID=UPI0015E35424|nr:hypothetical protein [Limosilactobacillus pontis]
MPEKITLFNHGDQADGHFKQPTTGGSDTTADACGNGRLGTFSCLSGKSLWQIID